MSTYQVLVCVEDLHRIHLVCFFRLKCRSVPVSSHFEQFYRAFPEGNRRSVLKGNQRQINRSRVRTRLTWCIIQSEIFMTRTECVGRWGLKYSLHWSSLFRFIGSRTYWRSDASWMILIFSIIWLPCLTRSLIAFQIATSSIQWVMRCAVFAGARDFRTGKVARTRWGIIAVFTMFQTERICRLFRMHRSRIVKTVSD